MIKLFTRRSIVLSLCLSLLFLLGCTSSPPTRFYTLSSLHDGGKNLKESTFDQDFIVGVGPIKFAEYLDRAEIVKRSSNNKITCSKFDVWAGSLAEDFSRVLIENLTFLLSTEKVIVYPRPGSASARYRVVMDVIRFEGSPRGEVSLIARWAILEGNEKKLVYVRRSSITEPSGGEGYEPMVAAYSRALEKLSREVAEAIRTVQK